MKKALLYYKGKARLIEPDPTWTADYWGNLEEHFADLARNGRKAKNLYEQFASVIPLYPENITPNGIRYDWGLAGPEGAWFTLIRFPTDTDEEIKEAKDHLRSSRDVVRMNTLRIKKLI